MCLKGANSLVINISEKVSGVQVMVAGAFSQGDSLAEGEVAGISFTSEVVL